MKHMHHDCIVAWANGAEIEFRSDLENIWKGLDGHSPQWYKDFDYRVKPEPKPDTTVYYRVTDEYVHYQGTAQVGKANVKFVFDGETHELKSVEKLV